MKRFKTAGCFIAAALMLILPFTASSTEAASIWGNIAKEASKELKKIPGKALKKIPGKKTAPSLPSAPDIGDVAKGGMDYRAKKPQRGTYDTFDYRAYANVYPDLKAAYGYDAAKLYAHWVNYGMKEGRVGTFIDGEDNPKEDAPIYGVSPDGPVGSLPSTTSWPFEYQGAVPATLLDPWPPRDASESPDWIRYECTHPWNASNAKLIAEFYSHKEYMTDDRPGCWRVEPVEIWTLDAYPQEINARIRDLEFIYNYEHDPNPSKLDRDAYPKVKAGITYRRAVKTDPAILIQYKLMRQRKLSFPKPPADPGTF